MIAVRELLGLARVPVHRTTATEWFRRNGIRTQWAKSQGGRTEAVFLSDLPPDLRQAYLERQADEACLEPGQYDDAAHVALAEAPVKAQTKAHDDAAKLLYIVKRERAGMAWPEIEKAGRKAFGTFPSRNTMKSWKRKTEGVDPANWAPALAPEWKGGSEGHPVSPEAWEMLCRCVYLGGKNGTGLPLKHAYHLVSDEAQVRGWEWPALHTIRRRWNSQDPVERLAMELGDERAEARLRLHQPQHSFSMSAMDLVDADGREFKVRCVWPDGYEGCPVVVALVDRASGKTVGYAVGKSENADVTESALLDMCTTHGRPLAIRLDNGGAFNSKRIAGGLEPFFRRKQMRDADWDVPGVLSILQIELRNTGVAAKKSNLQENVWSHLRHLDNHPAFHKAQRPGPNDPDTGRGAAVDIALFEQALMLEIARLNAATDNRVKGLRKGESRDMAFERLSKEGAKRIVTSLMRRRLNMVWKRKTVQSDGRIRFDGGYFGDAATQSTMLHYVGKKVLVGFNPQDYDTPAMVCTWEGKEKPGRLILETLPAATPTEHGSAEGRRNALTEKRRVRNLLRELRERYPDTDAGALRDMIRRQAKDAAPVRAATEERVVELPRRTGFSPEPAEAVTRPEQYLTDERMRNLAEATARRQAERF